MTIIKITSIALTALMLTSCGSSKKSSTSAPTVNIIPGDAELKAIQVKYPEVSMALLTEGHSIYVGACTNCHGQKSIYKRSEESWKHEVDVMAPKAKITELQKDALYKYILAMKATAPVPAK